MTFFSVIDMVGEIFRKMFEREISIYELVRQHLGIP